MGQYRFGRPAGPLRQAHLSPCHRSDCFQIEAQDGVGLTKEVLAITIDERVARATLASARRRFPGQEIVLRAKTNSGERVNLTI